MTRRPRTDKRLSRQRSHNVLPGRSACFRETQVSGLPKFLYANKISLSVRRHSLYGGFVGRLEVSHGQGGNDWLGQSQRP